MKKIYYSLIILITFLSLYFESAYGMLLYQPKTKNLYKEQANAIAVFNNEGAFTYITNSDVDLMAQTVFAESNCEPYEGKVAVASVILNRLKAKNFPNTVEKVIKQKGAFSCVKNGKIDVVADNSCYRAVLDAIKGYDPTHSALFYYNPKIATCKWMKNVKKTNSKKIGHHIFFVVK